MSRVCSPNGKGAVSIEVEFNLDQIHFFMKDFFAITQLRLALYDANFQVLAVYPSVGCQLCDMIGSTPEGRLRCHLSDNQGLRETRDLGKGFHYYRCHAGLIEYCFPIFFESEIAGYLIFGQLLDGTEDARQHVFYCCQELMDDVDAWRAAIALLQYADLQFIESCARIMQACVKSTLIENMLKIRRDPVWEKIDEYIQAHIGEKIRLSDISRDTFMSVSTISHKTKEITGQSVLMLILRRKMARACRYLISTDMRINEISVKVGIDDYNYFSRVFKKMFGFSPNGYRKLMRQGTSLE